MSDKREVIQQKFEQCLLDGLTGQPLVNKEGPVVDPTTGEVLMGPPDSSFLSVVRAYLKDITDPNSKEKVPQTGKAQGMLAAFEKKLPFGARPN
ncbi:hypothetical protein [Burkholderia ubonensis]|uniref:hypothetical protein n=1 Tax=Burkholderia ubonensis TaxID=101571 RepID=UPI00075D50CE|nr:hypothetical protein [Burkholderia ubonensis]KVL67351.1 hypothetical protein WJ48_13950 [Burkholderia ubonensis]KVL71404.1 hypothetical protein WJ49_20275 [Burkholderia ubonensis]KVL91293.1 hypothetical protein WJ50_11260 [Burkholderia ubonensis]KWK75597.1 hypothetical protein WM15_30595 [Burkholderia ubonensis]